MTDKVRVNLANPRELLELGISEEDAAAIVRFRDEHGPIADAEQLGVVLGPRIVSAEVMHRVDFSPAETTAPEAPGA